eukprot:Gb_01938 [translate_table: standard]
MEEETKGGKQGGGGVGYWLQYIIVLLGVQALLLMIFKRSSWLFSKEERPMRLRPTLSRVISFTSPAISPIFSPVTRRQSYVPDDHHDDQLPPPSSE